MLSAPVPSCLKLCMAYAVLLVLLLQGSHAQAQQDTSDKMIITIERTQRIVGIRTDTGEFQKFIGDVIIRQGSDTLYCDSAIQSKTTKNFEAFGNVRIAQADGTHGTSDYLRYTSGQKLAYMRGNVDLTDGKNNLICEELTYDLGTKIAQYDNWGTLHNDSTSVTSKTGTYSVNDKNAHFRGNAYIKDPQYKVTSEDIVYNTETKVTQFFARSVVTRDEGRSVLVTSNGWYDGLNGRAHFLGRSSIWNEGQYIEADTLDYDKQTGHGVASGNVISLDTEHHATMYCGHSEYFQKKRVAWATINPVLVQANGKDTLYMTADTFYSAPMEKTKFPWLQIPVDTFGQVDSTHSFPITKGREDSIAALKAIPVPKKKDTTGWAVPKNEDKKSKKKGKKDVATETVVVTDTTQADSTAPLYFIGYHHVVIFSDSLQGRCDSVCYTRADSMVRMIYSPIAWSRKSQVTGDTILMQLDSGSMKRLYVPNNAFLVSQSGPEKAHFFDQVQGKTLTAYFEKNEITHAVVYPNAEAIYYNKDEKGAYLGVSQASSIRMLIFFDDTKITKIKFEKDMHSVLSPLDKADIQAMKLSRFKWLPELRPRSKEELFK